jgi:hypothetical protein
MLRTIKQFITDSASRLSSQLTDFENNVLAETDSIRKGTLPRPAATARILTGGGIFTVGQVVTVDTSAGNYEINLASPQDGQSGWLYIQHVTSGTVTLRPIGTVLINNSATITHSAVGMLSVYWDGTGWYA